MSTKLQRHIAFIINPKSGTDRNKALEQLARQHYADQDVVLHFLVTAHAGHAIQLAKACAEKCFEAVIAVGGDGTVNEVAQGLINTNTMLGIIPKGSGNGLARACGIPLNELAAMQVVSRGYSKTIDTGVINNELFLSNTGVGLDAQVAQACMHQEKRGILMYIRNSIRMFASYKPLKYRITIDGEVYTEKAIMVSIANGNEFGYGFKISPTASHVDGKLDVMIIKPLNFFTASYVSFKAWYGNLHKYSKVKHLLGRQISIEAEGMSCHQIDGDYRANNGQVAAQIQAKSLQVLVP
ncbi:MAG: hypothetical protein RL660_914 [Bacteroidota bacterium]